MTSKKLSFIAAVLFSITTLPSLANKFDCSKVPTDSRFWKSSNKDSQAFQKLFDLNYMKQEARIKSFSSKVAHPDKARELFFDESTKFGRDNNQINQTELADLKTKFGYDSVIQFLIDTPDLIKPAAHFDKVMVSQNETLYVRNDKVIARLEKTKSDFVLTRFSKGCEPMDFSIFSERDSQSEAALQAKITNNFCQYQRSIGTKKIEAEEVEKTNSFVLGQESDEIEAPLKAQISNQCERLFPSAGQSSKVKPQSTKAKGTN